MICQGFLFPLSGNIEPKITTRCSPIMQKEFIDVLSRNLNMPLPGKEAQQEMAPSSRRRYVEAPDDAKIACVLALIYPKDGAEHLVLIERQGHPKDRHRGQIGFPGGKLEPTDESHAAGALREAEEEIGVPIHQVKLIGALTELYIPVSGFRVFPFVGYSAERPDFMRQESEVKSILEVPFGTFFTESVRKEKDIRVGKNITLPRVPYFDVEGHVVWGATAMMLSELIAVASKVQLN